MEGNNKQLSDIRELVRRLASEASVVSEPTDYAKIRKVHKEAIKSGYSPSRTHGIDPSIRDRKSTRLNSSH